MKRAGRVSLLTTLLVAALTATAAPSPAITLTPTAQQDPVPDPELEQAIDVRQMLGLETDRNFVAGLLEAPSAYLERSSILVTVAEALELDRRDTVAQWATSSAALLNADGTFAGSWTEPTTGVLHLAFVGTPSLIVSTLIAVIDATNPVQLEQVTRTEAQLDALQDAVWDARPALNALGVEVSSSFVDVTRNTVDVALSGTSNPQSVLQAVLGASSAGVTGRNSTGGGDDVSRDRSYGRAYGGLWMNFSPGDCTVGLANLQSNAMSSKWWIVTAGHCAPRYEHAYFGLGLNSPLGTVVKTLTTGPGATTNCDCEIVGPIPNERRSSDVLVSNNRVFDYTRTGNSSDFGVGNPACVSGAATVEATGSIKCGTMRSTNARGTTENGTPLVDMVIMTGLLSRKGDSGAPWGHNEAWLGVNSGRKDGNTYFSKSTSVSQFGVTARYGAGF